MSARDQLLPLVREVAAAYGVPFELLAATVQTESGWNVRAYRYEPHLGEASYGLCQTLYSTARGLGFTGRPEELYDAKTSLTYGAKYLAQMLNRFGSFGLASAAYNAGPGRVASAIKATGAADIEKIDAKLPAITRSYWRKIAVLAAMFAGSISATEANVRAKTLQLSETVRGFATGKGGSITAGIALVLLFVGVGLLVRS